MDNLKDESEFLHHTACPKCGSSDALSVFSDGHTYCFACEEYTNSEKAYNRPVGDTQQVKNTGKAFVKAEPAALTKRRISLDTCKKWGYGIGELKGKPVQVANYYDKDRTLVAQKLRFPDKTFSITGDMKKALLYGEWLWRDGGKQVTVVEGEIDALSLSQALDNKWPVVSIPLGAQAAKKAVANSMEWLAKFESVIFMFDMDEPGQTAAKECALMMPPNKAKIASLPLKDANEMLIAGRTKELINAIWEAKAFRPDGIICGTDLWEKVSVEEEVESIPYPWKIMQGMTDGIRKGEIITICAGSGVGKSQLARELAHHIHSTGESIGYIALEESTKRTAQGLMSIEANLPLHRKGKNILSTAELKKVFDATVGSGRVFMYDHWGSTESDNLLSKMRYLVKACGASYIILDHISIVVSGIEDGDERRLIDNTMTKLRTLVEEVNCALILISHLKRPQGDKGHEEGAFTSLSQLRGSAAIGQLSDLVIGMERNQQDAEHPNLSTLRVLKNRFTGETGIADYLDYVAETGRMVETTFDDATTEAGGRQTDKEDNDCPF